MRDIHYIAFFLFVAVIINLDRLLLGEFSSFRVLDTSEMYIDKIAFLKNFWLDPSNYSWDSYTLKGWPGNIGSINPNHLLVFFSLFLSIEYSFIAFFILSDFLIGLGAYLMFRRCFNLPAYLGILGSLFFLSSHYWYNENLMVTQFSFLPILVSILDFQRVRLQSIVRSILLIIIIASSYPPYVMPMMMFTHFIMNAFIANSKQEFIHLTIRWLLFWVIFCIFHFNGIFEILSVISDTNRSLWVPLETEYPSFLEQLFKFDFSYAYFLPLFAIVILAQKENLKSILLLVGVVGFFMLFFSFFESNEFFLLKERYEVIQTFSFAWGRLHNFFAPMVVCAAVYVVSKTKFSKLRIFKILIYFILFLLIVFAVINSNNMFGSGPRNAIALLIFSVFSLLYVIAPIISKRIFSRKKNLYIIAVLFILFLLPFKLKHQYLREQPDFGYIFVDKFEYSSEKKAFRVLSLMNEAHSFYLFPAQIKIKDIEVMDGMSVIYDKKDAQYWQDNVANKLTDQKSTYGFEFIHWNNWIEITARDFIDNLDYLLPFYKLNNVEFIRSPEKISHDHLQLMDEQTFKYRTWGSIILGREIIEKKIYLYKLSGSLYRVFSSAVKPDETILYFAQNNSIENIENINLQKYSPSNIIFNYIQEDDKNIYISTNFHPKWNLMINGVPSNNNLYQTEEGFLAIKPESGKNIYELQFNGAQKYILFQVIFGSLLILLFLNNNLSNSKLVRQLNN
jgi:hypothetical protein